MDIVERKNMSSKKTYLPNRLVAISRLSPATFLGAFALVLLFCASLRSQHLEKPLQLQVFSGTDFQLVSGNRLVWQSNPGQWAMTQVDADAFCREAFESVKNQKAKAIDRQLRSPKILEASASDGDWWSMGPLILSPDGGSFIDVSASRKDMVADDKNVPLKANIYSLPDGNLRQSLALRSYHYRAIPNKPQEVQVVLDSSGHRLFFVDQIGMILYERPTLEAPFQKVREMAIRSAVLPPLLPDSGAFAYAFWEDLDLVVNFENFLTKEKLGSFTLDDPKGIYSLVISPNGKYIAVATGHPRSGNGKEKLFLWDTEARTMCAEQKGDLSYCQTFLMPMFSADSTIIFAYCRANLNDHAFSVPEGKQLANFKQRNLIRNSRSEPNPVGLSENSAALLFAKNGRISTTRIHSEVGTPKDFGLDNSVGLDSSVGLAVRDFRTGEKHRATNNEYYVSSSDFPAFGGFNIRNERMIFRAVLFKDNRYQTKKENERKGFVYFDFSEALVLERTIQDLTQRFAGLKQWKTSAPQLAASEHKVEFVAARHTGLFHLPSGRLIGVNSQSPVWLSHAPQSNRVIAGFVDGSWTRYDGSKMPASFQLSGSNSERIWGSDAECRYLAHWTPGQPIEIVDATTGEPRYRLPMSSLAIQGIRVSRSGNEIAFWSDGELHLHSISQSSDATRTLMFSSPVSQAAFSDDDRLAVLTSDDQIYLWSVASGCLLDRTVMPKGSTIAGLVCDAKDRRVHLITDNLTVHTWEHCHWDEPQSIVTANSDLDWSESSASQKVPHSAMDVTIEAHAESNANMPILKVQIANRSEVDLVQCWGTVIPLGVNQQILPSVVGRIPAGKTVTFEIPLEGTPRTNAPVQVRFSLHATNLDSPIQKIFRQSR